MNLSRLLNGAESTTHHKKSNVTPALNTPLSLNKGTFVNSKKKDRFDKVSDSDRVTEPFYDMGDLEETQYFDEYALPDSTPPFF